MGELKIESISNIQLHNIIPYKKIMSEDFERTLQFQRLKEADISIMDNEGNYRPLCDILEDLSNNWDKIKGEIHYEE